MAEFKVVLDGLELTPDQHAEVSQAVLKAGIEAVGRIGRQTRAGLAPVDVVAVPIGSKYINDGLINGGMLLTAARALEVQASLFEGGLLSRELDVHFRG